MPRNTPWTSLRLGAAQFDAAAGDVAANAAAHVGLIDEAGSRGVQVLVFPELSLTGYAAALLAGAPERCIIDAADDALKPVRDACARNRVAAVVGGPLRGPRGLGLSALVIGRHGDIRAPDGRQLADAGSEQTGIARAVPRPRTKTATVVRRRRNSRTIDSAVPLAPKPSRATPITRNAK